MPPTLPAALSVKSLRDWQPWSKGSSLPPIAGAPDALPTEHRQFSEDLVERVHRRAFQVNCYSVHVWRGGIIRRFSRRSGERVHPITIRRQHCMADLGLAAPENQIVHGIPLNGGCCRTLSDTPRDLHERLHVILVISLYAHRTCYHPETKSVRIASRRWEGWDSYSYHAARPAGCLPGRCSGLRCSAETHRLA
jgi:hypothetical protein